MITFAPPISSLEQAQDIMRSSGRYSLVPELWRDVRVAIFPHLQRNADPLKDVSGGGFDLALDATNPPSWVSGDVGSVLSYDGTNDEASISSAAAIANLSNYSITALFNTTASSGAHEIYAEGNTTLAAPLVLFDVTPSTLRILLRDDGSTLKQVLGSSNVNDGRWHVGTATRNDDEWRLYLNGDKSGFGTATIGTTTIDDVTMGVLNIGGLKANFFPGKIGFCLTHARTLSPQEIQHLHRDPFAMLRPRRRKAFWAPISLGGLVKNPGTSGGMKELTGGMAA